jgi:nuclear pore complex protein Nup54
LTATTTSSPFSLTGQQTSTQPQNTSFGFGTTGNTGLGLQASSNIQNTTATPNQSTSAPATGTLQTDDLFTLALINPSAFNDERDTILSKWNQLQSFYGYGKIFYQNTAIDVNKDNKYTRFKVIIKIFR